MSEIELKPCPFCGNRYLLLHQTEYEKSLWVIICDRCHSEFTVARKRPLFGGRIKSGNRLSNHDDVVNAWNRRVDL